MYNTKAQAPQGSEHRRTSDEARATGYLVRNPKGVAQGGAHHTGYQPSVSGGRG